MLDVRRQIDLHVGKLARYRNHEKDGKTTAEYGSQAEDDHNPVQALYSPTLQQIHHRVQYVGQRKCDEQLQENGR